MAPPLRPLPRLRPPSPALPFGFSALFFLQPRFSVIRPPEDFSLRLLLFPLMLMDPMLTFRSLHLIDWADDGCRLPPVMDGRDLIEGLLFI